MLKNAFIYNGVAAEDDIPRLANALDGGARRRIALIAAGAETVVFIAADLAGVRVNLNAMLPAEKAFATDLAARPFAGCALGGRGDLVRHFDTLIRTFRRRRVEDFRGRRMKPGASCEGERGR
jgi:hypothetical protein